MASSPGRWWRTWISARGSTSSRSACSWAGMPSKPSVLTPSTGSLAKFYAKLQTGPSATSWTTSTTTSKTRGPCSHGRPLRALVSFYLSFMSGEFLQSYTVADILLSIFLYTTSQESKYFW